MNRTQQRGGGYRNIKHIDTVNEKGGVVRSGRKVEGVLEERSCKFDSILLSEREQGWLGH